MNKSSLRKINRRAARDGRPFPYCLKARYIVFENVIPENEYLKEMELNRWADYQVRAGKSVEEAEIHKARCGLFYYPLAMARHEQLLQKAIVEMFLEIGS